MNEITFINSSNFIEYVKYDQKKGQVMRLLMDPYDTSEIDVIAMPQVVLQMEDGETISAHYDELLPSEAPEQMKDFIEGLHAFQNEHELRPELADLCNEELEVKAQSVNPHDSGSLSHRAFQNGFVAMSYKL